MTFWTICIGLFGWGFYDSDFGQLSESQYFNNQGSHKTCFSGQQWIFGIFSMCLLKFKRLYKQMFVYFFGCGCKHVEDREAVYFANLASLAPWVETKTLDSDIENKDNMCVQY